MNHKNGGNINLCQYFFLLKKQNIILEIYLYCYTGVGKVDLGRGIEIFDFPYKK